MNKSEFQIGDIIVDKKSGTTGVKLLVVHEVDDALICLSGEDFEPVTIGKDWQQYYMSLDDRKDLSEVASMFRFADMPKTSVEDIKNWLKYNLSRDDEKSLIPKEFKQAEKLALKILDSLSGLETRIMKEICKQSHRGSLPPCINNTSDCDFKEVSVSEIQSAIHSVLEDVVMEIGEEN